MGLAKSKTNQAATFINLFQTLGGSFGIAAIETIIARRTQFHQSRLVDHLTFTNPDYAASVRQFATSAFGRVNSSLVDATQQAQAAIYRSIVQQSTIIAYDDAFYVLTIICVLSIGLVFFMKPNKPGEDEGGGEARSQLSVVSLVRVSWRVQRSQSVLFSAALFFCDKALR